MGWRLLLAYLTIMASIFGFSAAVVYYFFVHSLYQQLDSRLLTLAQAAAPSLTAVKTEGDKHLNRREEIPWQELFHRNQQSLSWFNERGHKLATQGAIKIELPPQTGILTLRQQHIRLFTIPVYSRRPDQSHLELEGYIRAGESTTEIEDITTRLQWGFGLGGLITLTLSGVGGMWLVQKSLEPTRRSLQRLKEFTADASHELRSPLTAVKTSIEVILKHPERIHPKDVRKLMAIASATDQMAHLVEDLLFLARTDHLYVNRAKERIRVQLDQILHDLLTLLEPQAQHRGITLHYTPLPSIEMIGDQNKLNRLFANLLENALHYTPQGGTVSLAVSQTAKFVIITIEDTGIGIASPYLPLIFQRFWRAETAQSHRSNGIGLGLAIAQAIAHYHDGEITVSSSPGQGSCFRVRLPLAIVTTPPIEHIHSTRL